MQENKNSQKKHGREEYNISETLRVQTIRRVTIDNLLETTEADRETLEKQTFRLDTTNDMIIKYEQH